VTGVKYGKRAFEEFDVVVAGGGPSGLIAATAAGRLGTKTLLIEREGFLGGMGTAGMVAQFFGFFHKESQVVRGIPEEFTEQIKKAGGSNGFERYVMMEAGLSTTPIVLFGFPFNPEIAKIVADEFVAAAGVHILFHTQVVGVSMENNRVTRIVIEGIGGRREISAKTIVDATGDAVIAKRAGVEVMGEEEGFRKVRMPLTLVFRLTDVDLPRLRALPRERKKEIVRKGLQEGWIPWESLGFFGVPGTNDAICLMGRISGLDSLNDEDLSKAEIIGRQQAKSIIEFIRGEVPGFERCKLGGIAPRVGIRETRRIVGLYTLTDQDMFESRPFKDAVSLSSGYLDIHDHEGTGILLRELDNPFEIPMRCMLPAAVEGSSLLGARFQQREW